MPIGKSIDLSIHYSFLERCVTIFWFVLPPLAAMAELWLRLFAGFISPAVVCYLIYMCGNLNNKHSKWSSIAIVSGVASTGVLLTDAMYVQEYGRSFGVSMFIATTSLLVTLERMHIGNKNAKVPQPYRTVIVFITFLIIMALMNDMRGGTKSIDLPDIEPGLYFNNYNMKMAQAVTLWKSESEVSLSYEEISTKYLLTGDSRTGIPFIINKVVPVPDYVRRWVATPDGEAVALDIAFPSDGTYNPNKPVYLVLHGLNGGSKEEYVMEFVSRETQRGSIVCVMVARGLMDTPIYGKNVFHGARITDISEAAIALKHIMKNDQALIGAGYSMGAIVMANYVARSGKDCYLDAAIVVSGG